MFGSGEIAIFRERMIIRPGIIRVMMSATN